MGAPVSRSIIIVLKASEKVAVLQERKGAERSYRPTFSANLVPPSAPVSWHKFSDPLPIELKTDETYAKPKAQELGTQRRSKGSRGLDAKSKVRSQVSKDSALPEGRCCG